MIAVCTEVQNKVNCAKKVDMMFLIVHGLFFWDSDSVPADLIIWWFNWSSSCLYYFFLMDLDVTGNAGVYCSSLIPLKLWGS